MIHACLQFSQSKSARITPPLRYDFLMEMRWRRPKQHRHPNCGIEATSRTGSNGISRTSFPTGRLAGRVRRARNQDRRVRRSSGSPKRAPSPLAAMKLSDEIGQLTYKVWYFASLRYDEDQRDNQINARRQRYNSLAKRVRRALFNPELLAIPLPTIQKWMTANADWRCTASHSRICTDSRNTSSMTRASGCCRCPAAFRHRRTTVLRAFDRGRLLPDGPPAERRRGTLTYGQYRAILATHRNQATAQRRSTSSTSSTPPMSTPMPRCITACCSATGFTRGT